MFDHFCDYMYYLLTAPFKKLKKSVNQWYILFAVLGARYDDALESLYSAREQTMVATCDPVMLQVQAQDRNMERYAGEGDENFRARMANYPEVLRLGGTDEGVLLAIKVLGYNDPKIIKANDFKGRVYHEIDGTWNLDGSHLLESNTMLPDRWAEFYVVINMNVDDSHPVALDVLKKEVRRVKQVGAKDNYCFQYGLSVKEPHWIRLWADYKLKIFYWNYHMTDGTWHVNGNILLDAVRSLYTVMTGYKFKFKFKRDISLANKFILHIHEYKEQIKIGDNYNISIFYWRYHMTDGTWATDGNILLNSYRTKFDVKDTHKTVVTHKVKMSQGILHNKYHLRHLDGAWHLDGETSTDAWEQKIIL